MVTNAIAGDKRYSLATLLSNESGSSGQGEGSRNVSRRLVSGGQRPLMPSQIVNAGQAGPSNTKDRMPSYRSHPPPALATYGPQSNMSLDGPGLLVSARILPQQSSNPDNQTEAPLSEVYGGKKSRIQPFEVFTVEIFVYNRTDEVRRFNIGISRRDRDSEAGAVGQKIKEVWARRRRRGKDEHPWGMDDNSKQMRV